MTTLRWENVPTNVKVGTYGVTAATYSARLTYVCVECGLSADRDRTVLIVQNDGKRLCAGCILLDSMRANKPCTPEADALDDLRTQLSEARSERDRYIARCGELEARLQTIRETAR